MVHFYKKKWYLHACVNAGLASLQEHDREQLAQLNDYVRKHANALWYIHAIDTGGAEIARILFSYARVSFTPEVQTFFEAFIDRLVHDKAVQLLPDLLHSLQEITDTAQAVVRAKIFVSHAVSPEYARGVVDYFSFMVKKQIIPEFIIAPHLIAGLRCETAQFIWEDSVRQRLRAIDVHTQG